MIERLGCDPHALDPSNAEDRLWLLASVWPDQPVRFGRLRAALSIAERVPATVDSEKASEWLPRQLVRPVEGAATVVFESVVDQYLSEAERQIVQGAIDVAGERASLRAALAWVKLEPDPNVRAFGVDLSMWPGGVTRRIATSGPHGDRVRWL